MQAGYGFQRSTEKVLQEDFSRLRFEHLVLAWYNEVSLDRRTIARRLVPEELLRCAA